MTLHMRRVDDSTKVYDGEQPLEVPEGWQIADGSADDVRVCGAHPWQSRCLVFANGDSYGTAACWDSTCIGDRHLKCFSRKITNNDEITTPLKLKSGSKYGSGGFSTDENGVRAAGSSYDVLLRKRA